LKLLGNKAQHTRHAAQEKIAVKSLILLATSAAEAVPSSM
jgi:hypothetical protein